MIGQREMLPASKDTEALVLGVLLTDPDALAPILAVTEPDWFSYEPYRTIYDAICGLQARGRQFDRVVVIQALQAAGKLEAAGGVAGIVGLDTGLPQIYALDGYLDILREKAILRRGARLAEKLFAECCSGTGSRETIERAESFLRALSAEATAARPTLMNLGEYLASSPNGLNALFDAETERVAPWPLGLEPVLNGIREGQLIVVGARPGMGKSALAAQVAVDVARAGQPVAMFSLEMDRAQIFRRMVANISSTPMHRITRGALDATGRAAIQSAATDLDASPLYIDDTGRANVASITNAIRRHNGAYPERKIRMAVIDYLQLMRAPGRQSRVEEVGELSRALKLAAMELKIPFLVLAQLNRESAREDRMPEMFDLRESGSIENDADVVLLMHLTRRERADALQEKRPMVLDLVVAKNRNGGIGVKRVRFRSDLMRMESAE